MKIEGNAPIALETSILLLATVSIYWQDLTLIANEALNSELASHILAIPFLLAYIIYRIRRVITAKMTSNLHT